MANERIEKPEGVSQEQWDRVRAAANSEEAQRILNQALESDDSSSTED